MGRVIYMNGRLVPENEAVGYFYTYTLQEKG